MLTEIRGKYFVSSASAVSSRYIRTKYSHLIKRGSKIIFLALEQTRPILAYVNSPTSSSNERVHFVFDPVVSSSDSPVLHLLSFMPLAHFLFVGRNIVFNTELHLGHGIGCSLLTVGLPWIPVIMTRTDDDKGPKGF